MANPSRVDIGHTHEDLAHKVFDAIHGNKSALLFRILYDFLEILLAELEDQVLHHLPFLILRVVDVQKLDDVLAAAQSVEHFELARDILTTLACSLYSDGLTRVWIDRLKNVTCTPKIAVIKSLTINLL